MLLDTHGENAHTHGTQSKQRKTDAQAHSKHTQERINGGKSLTQFYVLIVSEDEDDVGSDVADLAVSLQAGPEAIPRQVSGALGHREDSHQDKEEERERGREPPPCHHATLQSPPQCFVSHTHTSAAPSLNLRDGARKETDKNKTHTHMHTHKTW